MAAPTATRPTPEPDERSQEFFDGAARGELMLVRCNACETWLAPGAPICTECLGRDIRWEAASGRGEVFTFAVMHQLYHPGFASELPYNVAVVELEEGPRIQTNLVGIENDDIEVGMAVTATFEPHGDGSVTLPKFTPA